MQKIFVEYLQGIPKESSIKIFRKGWGSYFPFLNEKNNLYQSHLKKKLTYSKKLQARQFSQNCFSSWSDILIQSFYFFKCRIYRQNSPNLSPKISQKISLYTSLATISSFANIDESVTFLLYGLNANFFWYDVDISCSFWKILLTLY